MATFTIRDIPDSVADAIREHAGAEGMTTEAWVRKQLEALANGPIVHRAYAITAFSPGGLALQLGRFPDGRAEVLGRYALPQEANSWIEGWLALLRRNAPGDREAAIWQMGPMFEQVFETPLTSAILMRVHEAK